MDHYMFYDRTHTETARKLTELGAIDSVVEFFAGPYGGVAVWHDQGPESAPHVADPLCVPLLGCVPVGGGGDGSPSKVKPPDTDWLAWVHILPKPGNIRDFLGSVEGADVLGLARVISPEPGVLIELSDPDFESLQDRVLTLVDVNTVQSVTVSLSTGALKLSAAPAS